MESQLGTAERRTGTCKQSFLRQREYLVYFSLCLKTILFHSLFQTSNNFFSYNYRLNRDTGLLETSVFQFKEKSLNSIGRLVLNVYQTFGLIRVEKANEDAEMFESTNCTLINYVLKLVGPTHENTLVIYLMALQVNFFKT